MWSDWKVPILLIGGIIVAILIMYVSSCGLFSVQHNPNITPAPISPPISTPQTPTTQTIIKTIEKTDWLMSLFIFMFVLGVMTTIWGSSLGLGKIGFTVIIGAIAGIALKMAIAVTWAYQVMCGIFVGIVVLLLVYALSTRVKILKNKAVALKEVVTGIQKAKDTVLEGLEKEGVALKKMVNGALVNEQSKQTQQIVQDIKSEIKS